MGNKKRLPRAELTDFCEFRKWYPKKGKIEDILMNYLSNPAELMDVAKIGLSVPKLVDCKRGLMKDKEWFATLSLEQYSAGHTIVVSSKHFDDVTDKRCIRNKNVLEEFWWGVQRCAMKLKKMLGAERIYVGCLCDGVKHLHVHLIPRYKDDKRGFEFMGERERLYKEGFLNTCLKPIESKRIYLEGLATLILRSS